MEFDINKFNPTVAELTALADEYCILSIAGIDDEEWYAKVKAAEKHLWERRRYVVATAKTWREDAISFQKKIINVEKELVGIVSETEQELKAMRKVIDDKKEMIKRKKALVTRREALLEKNIEATDEFILSLSFDEFTVWVKVKEEELFEAEKLKLAEEKLKLQREKEELEREKENAQIRKEEKVAAEKRAKEVAAENKRKLADAKIKAEKDKEAAVEKAKSDAEAKLKKELEDAAERVRLIAAEETKLLDEEEKKQADIIKKQEWNKRYIAWLEENNHDKITDFIAVKEGKRILYRQVSEFNLEETPKETDFEVALKQERGEMPTDELLDWFSK